MHVAFYFLFLFSLFLLMGKFKWCRVEVKPAGTGKKALKTVCVVAWFNYCLRVENGNLIVKCLSVKDRIPVDGS